MLHLLFKVQFQKYTLLNLLFMITVLCQQTTHDESINHNKHHHNSNMNNHHQNSKFKKYIFIDVGGNIADTVENF